VLLEYESDLIPKISHRRAALADLGKTLKPEIGDAMQRIRRCRDQLLDWRKQEKSMASSARCKPYYMSFPIGAPISK